MENCWDECFSSFLETVSSVSVCSLDLWINIISKCGKNQTLSHCPIYSDANNNIFLSNADKLIIIINFRFMNCKIKFTFFLHFVSLCIWKQYRIRGKIRFNARKNVEIKEIFSQMIEKILCKNRKRCKIFFCNKFWRNKFFEWWRIFRISTVGQYS